MSELYAETFPRFQYQPLFTSEVRLLKVHPGDHNDRIHFSVIHVNLARAERTFVALSYTWGPPDPAHLLVHHDTEQRLSVTENCEKAIRRLRHYEHDVLLWVDAICINQIDLAERQAQVSRMHDIYRLASSVVAYIGEEAEGSAAAMTYLASVPNSQWDVTISASLQRALEDLLCRPWFSRVWVLQEVYNAPSVRLVCGQHEADWSNLQLYRWWHRLGRKDIYHWPLVTTIKDRSSYAAKDLTSLLTQARRCGATDERDKLYALLPILRDARQQELFPDYTLSREEVFLKFAKYISLDGIEFLCAVSHPSEAMNSSKLPTWVPQWDRDDGCVPLYPNTGRAMLEEPERTRNFDIAYSPYRINETSFYGSGGAKESSIADIIYSGEQSSRFPRLSVRGVRITTIRKLSSPIQVSVEKLLKCRGKAKGWFSRWPTRPDANSLYSGGFDHPAAHPLHQTMDHALNSIMWSPHNIHQVGNNIGDAMGMHIRRETDQTYRTWREEVVGVLNGRRIFVTEDGGKGLAPVDALPGDLICILFGLPTPCVLRPVIEGGACFFFVGCCYLNGMMKQDAIEKLRAKAKTMGHVDAEFERDFVLL